MDPLIKSQLLYQLSYAPTRPAKTGVGGHIAADSGPVQPCRNHFPTNRTQGVFIPGEALGASDEKPAFRHLDRVAANASGSQFSALDIEFEANA